MIASLVFLTMSFVPPGTTTLPSVFLAGAEYSSYSSPHFSGFAAIALPVSAPAGLYSWSMEQFLLAHGKLVTSVTTGAADNLKSQCWKRGCLSLVGIATAGVSTSTVTQAAFSGGGGVLWRWHNGWCAGLFELQNNAAGVSRPNTLIGGGRTW